MNEFIGLIIPSIIFEEIFEDYSQLIANNLTLNFIFAISF